MSCPRIHRTSDPQIDGRPHYLLRLLPRDSQNDIIWLFPKKLWHLTIRKCWRNTMCLVFPALSAWSGFCHSLFHLISSLAPLKMTMATRGCSQTINPDNYKLLPLQLANFNPIDTYGRVGIIMCDGIHPPIEVHLENQCQGTCSGDL